MSMGLFTMFIKIKAHRREFLNEKANRWANEGREDMDNVRWDGPTLQPTFSWTEEGVEHRCSMNKTLRNRVHLKVSELQLPLHKNYTLEFLNREDISRDLLGTHWQDKTVPDRSKRRLLQSIGHQFPCAKLLKIWGLRDNDECISVNVSTRRCRHGWKASAISKLVAWLSKNQELRYTMASGVNYSQPSVGTPWNPTMTAIGNCTSLERLARLPMTSGQSVKSSCT